MQPTETPAQDEGKGVLVVYFSATGTTKRVAEQVVSSTGGELYQIVPEQPYTDEDLNYTNPDSRSQVEGQDPEARPAISGSVEGLEKYKTVFLGYPIWNGQAPKIVSTFLESYDFAGVTIVPFCTSASSGIGTSASDLEDLAAGATWLEGRRFSGSALNTDIQTWIDELGL